jgi:D-tyrosyl-tRNA(Tyr) deacylase
MRIVLQRVNRAEVRVGGETRGRIGLGFLLLVGIAPKDDDEMLQKAAKKIAGLRLFEDREGKINLDLKLVGGEILAVPQFTLYADTRKGNRPSFTGAAEPEKARNLFNRLVELLKFEGIKVQTGVFGQRMEVELVNYGPVTIILEFN